MPRIVLGHAFTEWNGGAVTAAATQEGFLLGISSGERRCAQRLIIFAKGWILYIIIYTIIRFIICVILKLYINQELPWRLLIWDTILNITLASIYGFIINYWIKIISPA
mgnify:CR=1 FL=1